MNQRTQAAIAAALVVASVVPREARGDDAAVQSRTRLTTRRTKEEEANDRELADAMCPPGDRTDWRFDEQRLRTDTVDWIELPGRSFDTQCETWRAPGNVAACSYVYRDAEGGTYGVVYTPGPKYSVSEGLQNHELCHLKGWTHDQARGRVDLPVWRTR